MKKSAWQWLIPLFAFLVFLPFSAFLDLKIAQLCYRENHFIDNAFTRFIYTYGEWPAFCFCSGSFLLFIFSWFNPTLKKWQKPLCSIILTFILGAGLLVNGILKEQIERPRPKQITQLGGRYTFKPVYQPQFIWKQKPDGQKSFPSGHVTTGAYFFILIILGKRLKNRPMLLTGFWISGIWTSLLMMARIMQGAHFLSDTLTAVLIMWWTALFVDNFVSHRLWLNFFHRSKI